MMNMMNMMNMMRIKMKMKIDLSSDKSFLYFEQKTKWKERCFGRHGDMFMEDWHHNEWQDEGQVRGFD